MSDYVSQMLSILCADVSCPAYQPALHFPIRINCWPTWPTWPDHVRADASRLQQYHSVFLVQSCRPSFESPLLEGFNTYGPGKWPPSRLVRIYELVTTAIRQCDILTSTTLENECFIYAIKGYTCPCDWIYAFMACDGLGVMSLGVN